MRKTAGFLGAIAVATLLTGGIASAQQGHGIGRLDQLFGQIDLDASGTLTVREMRAAAAARFNALDINGDGTVHPDERRDSRGNRLKIHFERADRDRNGRLDAQEMQEVARQQANRRIAHLDRDGDGMLSLEEMQQENRGYGHKPAPAAGILTLPMLDAQMMAMFRRADRDGNGVVTLNEAIAAGTG